MKIQIYMTQEELKKMREENSVEEIQKSLLDELKLNGDEMTALRALKKGDLFRLAGIKVRERALRGGGSLYPVNYVTSLGNQIDSENFAKIVDAPDEMPNLGTSVKEKVNFAAWCIKNNPLFRVKSVKLQDEVTFTDDEGKERTFTPKSFEIQVVTEE